MILELYYIPRQHFEDMSCCYLTSYVQETSPRYFIIVRKEKEKKFCNSPSNHPDRKKISGKHFTSAQLQWVLSGSRKKCRTYWELSELLGGRKWISDLVCECPQITMILETGLWAPLSAEHLICNLATISQAPYVIFNDIDNTEEGIIGFGFVWVFLSFI